MSRKERMRRRRTTTATAPKRGQYERGKSAGERREEQRERLLAAAAEIFGASGYAGASVEAIVSRVGMSRRTFYEHFDDLDDVLLQLAEFGADALYEEVQARTATVEDPVEKLRLAVQAFLETVAARGAVARVIFQEMRAAGPKFAARHHAVLQRFAALLSEGVADAYARGAVSRPPDDITAFALIAGMEAVGLEYVRRGQEGRALEAAPALVELIYRAFR
jgi:AcrR family transcriptional regulator